MYTVKFLVILPKENDSEQNTIILCEDGGVATLHHNGEHIIAELYQNRITKDTDLSTMFEELAEGKMYIQDYPEDNQVYPNHIKECAEWLYASTEQELFCFEVHYEQDIDDFDYQLSDWLTLNGKGE